MDMLSLRIRLKSLNLYDENEKGTFPSHLLFR